MSKALAEQLLGELSLEQLDLDIFRAHSNTQLGDRLFGGLVLGQALSALQKTVKEDQCVTPSCVLFAAWEGESTRYIPCRPNTRWEEFYDAPCQGRSKRGSHFQHGRLVSSQ